MTDKVGEAIKLEKNTDLLSRFPPSSQEKAYSYIQLPVIAWRELH